MTLSTDTNSTNSSNPASARISREFIGRYRLAKNSWWRSSRGISKLSSRFVQKISVCDLLYGLRRNGFNSRSSRLPTQAGVDHRTSEVGLVFCKCGEAREEIEIRLFMKPVRLGSAAIAAVRYDEKKRTLYVEFREGGTYRYSHVPEFVYRELLKAESAGAFWNAIKDQFEYEKLN